MHLRTLPTRKNNVSWHKFALSKPLLVAAWAVLGKSSHNAPQVERCRGPHALQSFPTAEEAVKSAEERKGGIMALVACGVPQKVVDSISIFD